MRNKSPMRHPGTEDASLLVVPGAVLGAYVLTRLPLSMLTGLALGFVFGWTLRGEQMSGYAMRPSKRGREWLSEHEPQPSGRMAPDERVDDMSEDSFPASDPPSYTATRTGKPS